MRQWIVSYMCLTGYIFVSCNHYRSLDFLPAVFKLFPVSTVCLCQSVCLFVCVHVCITLSLFTRCPGLWLSGAHSTSCFTRVPTTLSFHSQCHQTSVTHIQLWCIWPPISLTESSTTPKEHTTPGTVRSPQVLSHPVSFTEIVLIYCCCYMCIISSLSVCPMREEHLDGVQALSSSLNASSDLLTDVSNYLQAGRDPLNQVTEHTHTHTHTHTHNASLQPVCLMNWFWNFKFPFLILPLYFNPKSNKISK